MTKIKMISDEDVRIGEESNVLWENYKEADEVAKKSGNKKDDEKAVKVLEKWREHWRTNAKHLTVPRVN